MLHYVQMAATQNLTKIKDGTLIPRPYDELTAVQRSYVDFKAVGGVITDDDGVHKMTVGQLAAQLGVTRDAIYQSIKYMPNFDDLVAERRKQLSGGARLQRIHTLWYVHASKFDDWRVTEAWLRNFDPNYKEPKQKVEHEASETLLDAMSAARERRQQLANAQEGEVIDAQNIDS